jgi:adenosylcobinamide kinase/adenosylcobinamide-phosphate guanylyltransferase
VDPCSGAIGRIKLADSRKAEEWKKHFQYLYENGVSVKELILGGARSGKSSRAEIIAMASGLKVIYVATATAGDREMEERIAHHRDRRPETWELVEEPIRLASALVSNASPDSCLLVDCLTLWLSNLLCNEDEALFRKEHGRLLKLLPALSGHIILVSNEVGMGIAPADSLSRRFRDEAGRLHQELAQICDRVTVVVAGLPQILKGK